MDELLGWNASQFGGVQSVTLLPTQVWLPDFGITNRSVAALNYVREGKAPAPPDPVHGK